MSLMNRRLAPRRYRVEGDKMFDNLREDLRRYGSGTHQQIRAIILTPPLWAIIGYRFARWVNTAHLPGPIRKLLRIVSTLTNLWVGVATNIELPSEARIGPGLFIAHTGYIVLGAGVVMGHHCTLTQGVTIGHAGGGNNSFECPSIGNRVYVGPGSAIIGPVTVGDDCLIGVNAVVTQSIPPRAVALGNPARVKSLKGSFALIMYPGMETDLERKSALEEVEQGEIVAKDIDGAFV